MTETRPGMITARHGDRGAHPMPLVPRRMAEALADEAVPQHVLRARYPALLALARTVLGETPDAFSLFAMDPTSFRWYRQLMPRLLHLPGPLRTRYRLREETTLAMWAASRAGGSEYCDIHSCNMALRAGVEARKLIDPQTSPYDTGERIVIQVALGLGPNPPELTPAVHYSFTTAGSYNDRERERILHAIWMMGALNEINDGTGIAPEPPLVAAALAVMRETGWTPRLVPPAELRQIHAELPPRYQDGAVLRLTPHALREALRCRRWEQGIPRRSGRSMVRYLRRRTGHGWPALAHIRDTAVRRAIACVLRDAHDPRRSPVPMHAKLRAGQTYAHKIGDPHLIQAADDLAEHHRLDPGRTSRSGPRSRWLRAWPHGS